MKREVYESILANYENELARQDSLHSTGSVGKLAEVLIRNDMMKRGISKAADIRCRSAVKADLRLGNSTRVEIKTGSGAVAYGYNLTVEELTADPDRICAGAQVVIWAPFPKALQVGHGSYNKAAAWVFTHEQFIETLEAIGKNGLRSSLKVSKGGAQVNIQTITPRMEDRLWDILENIPTLEDFMEDRT